MTEPTKPKRKYNRNDDKYPSQSKEARAKRAKERENKLNEIAIAFGFKSKSDMHTAILKGEAIVTKVSTES